MSWDVGVLWASWRVGTGRANFLSLGLAPCPHQPACIPLRGPWPITPVFRMATVKRELMKNLTSEEAIHHNKISIVATGLVGVACAVSILLQGSCDELALMDATESSKLKGQTMALPHGSPCMKMPNIGAGKEHLSLQTPT